jgi:drug/metabolite transporter (DMT)-like permease
VIYLKLLAVALLWGGTFIAGRIAAPVLPHFTIAALRFAVGFAILAVGLQLRERGWPRLDARQLALTALLALTGLFAYNLFFLGALALIPAGRTALVVALNPVATALAMALVFREPLAAHRWLGIALALAGVWIVVSKGDPALLLARVGRGELLMLGGALSWAVYTILQRVLFATRDPPSPLAAATVASVWGMLFLGLGIPFEWGAWSAADLAPSILAAIVFLGAGGTAVAFVWYGEGVQRLGPARAAVFNNLVPVFGAALAALLLGEPILVSMIVGGLVALAGVTLTNLPARRRAASSSEDPA